MTTTVSSKNQIVIPKAIRQKTGVGPGAVLYPHVNRGGEIVLSTKPHWLKAAGSMPGVWSQYGDPVELIRKERERSDRR